MLKEITDRQELQVSLDKTATGMLQVLDKFNPRSINSIPFEGSWTAAQVADHITKSNTSIAKALNLSGTMINRDPAVRIKELKDVFLNFETKFKSPDFILPGHEEYEKGTVIVHLKQSTENIREVSSRVDLSEMINHPAFGDITKFEILHFVMYHTQRHTHQLENIYRHLQNKTG
jgi:DinB superfamily